MSEAVIYTQQRKARHFTDAMLAGFPARQVPSEPGQLDPAAGLHILGGLQFGSLALMQQLLGSGRDYVFWDRAYFGGGTHTDRLRITVNGYQQTQVQPGRDLQRFKSLGGELQPWRAAGQHIMVVPPSAAIGALFGFNVDQWELHTLCELSRHTDRPVMLSRKGDPRPLAERFKGCHAVVTYSSNVAVEAICAGVPAFVSGVSAASRVGSSIKDLNRIETPHRATDAQRSAWAASLAWGQFSTTEIRRGFARAALLENNT
jgi:hypothetical protein